MSGKKKVIILSAIWIALLGVAVILNIPAPKDDINAFYNWKTIQKKGYLRAGILQNTTDYYVENGDIKGFHYDMLELFGKQYKLDVNYAVYHTYWDNFWALATGEIDVLAMDLNNDPQYNSYSLFTNPHSYSHHVLVQHNSNKIVDGNFNIMPHQDSLLSRTFLLKIHCFSCFYQDALYLSRKLESLNIELSLDETMNINDVLTLLGEKKIDLTIASQKVMESNAILYKDMDYSVILTDTIALHWAVNKQNTSLQEIFNHWLDSIKTTQHYAILLEKYYSPSSKNRRTIGQYQQKYSNNPISFYDDLIKKYAARYNLDWRLVSAVIYRESRFNSQAIGKGGSFGLMQIMPKTAKHLGMSNPNSPENQILYGCKYLKRLKMKYLEKGADTTDIYKFVLAAYNAGSCHIDDAILLAKSKGYNPNSWQDVEKMLIRLSDKKYTKNIPLRCGNYNGKHTKNYVNKVWTSYLHYQNMVD